MDELEKKCLEFCATGSYQQGLRVKYTRVLLDQPRRRRLKAKEYIYKKNSSGEGYALRNKLRLYMQIIIK